jgi:hypothetical protein
MDSENKRSAQATSGGKIRWGRVLLAAIMSEVGVVVVLLIATAAYTTFGPPISDAESASLGEEVGFYVAPAAGLVTTFLAVLWAARPLVGRFITHGMLVGLGSVLVSVGFIFTAQPEHRLMYVIAFLLRLLAGLGGGALAQWRFAARAAHASGARRTGADAAH